nr:MAG TPA: hypothetical protein [Caudoviricetes sp.]
MMKKIIGLHLNGKQYEGERRKKDGRKKPD